MGGEECRGEKRERDGGRVRVVHSLFPYTLLSISETRRSKEKAGEMEKR